MSREPAPRRAIVMGGGGVLGFAWTLGALAAVEEVVGFDARSVELVVGTSAGSVAAALLGCGLAVEVICRHHQGQAASDDPLIDYDYQSATGPALPPWPGWRPASPRLTWDTLRHPRGSSALVAVSGLLPAGRGTLAPIAELVAAVAAATGSAAAWPTRPRPWIVAVDYRTGRRVVFGRDTVAPGPDGVPRILRRAPLADAVVASCSIPAWYPPQVIDGVRYIDGGTVSNASVDLLESQAVDEVFVLAPMASLHSDRPRRVSVRVERAIRRSITRGILGDVAALRRRGVRVRVLTPGPEDLRAIGANVMNPARRLEVLETSRRTVAAQLAGQIANSQLSPGPEGGATP